MKLAIALEEKSPNIAPQDTHHLSLRWRNRQARGWNRDQLTASEVVLFRTTKIT
ncbi:MAG: hypothetical protein F6J95_002725 [Leptolyngbya sp. SIO1E4]|nr:hypothetical protein [Leptolyngbya sp. SIO1E4]